MKLKSVAIALGVAGYVGLGIAGTLAASAAAFELAHRQWPGDWSLSRTFGYWNATEDRPQERKRLAASIGLPALAWFVVLPALVAGAGRARPLHGAARFATRSEIERAGLFASRGIVLGGYQGRYLVLPGQQSVLLSAPMRSGKGVGIVIPNLLSWGDSVVVCDIKGENFAITAGFRARHGQAVYAWAPFAADGRSHRWNPLSTIRSDARFTVGDVLQIAQVLYPSDLKGSGTEAFFNDQARNLFLGLVLWLVETPDRPRTIGELLRQASGQGRPIKDHLQALIGERQRAGRPLSDACVDALMRFLNTSDNTLTSILATLNAPLTVFAEPLVDAATSGDDFSLQDVRRRRMSVYLCIPPNRLADAAVLLNLFFSQLVNLNTTQLPEHHPELQAQCLLLMDEFTAMGRIAVLARAIGYLAGYNLRCLTVIQAVSQLDSVYGDKDARTFATNHAVQILYAPREQRDANEYSEMLGTFTQQETSRGRSVNQGARGGGTSLSTNTSSQRRALLLPQEFKELGLAREVLIVENVKPILADKIRYYDETVFAQRVLPPPVIPLIDLDLHRARVEQRVRVAEPDEQVTAEQIAVDFSSMEPPAAGAAADEGFVRGVFQRLDANRDLAPGPVGSSPGPSMNPVQRPSHDPTP